MAIKDKFVTFAQFLACPYILNFDAIKPYVNSISVLLVGSVSAGICTPSSNVDICLLCTRDTVNKISPDIEFNSGKYVEMTISGVNTRFYFDAIEDVLEGLNKMDDSTFFSYLYAIPLDDVSGAYKHLQKYIIDNKLIEKRKKHVYNHMMRRRRNLNSYLENCADKFGRITVAQDTLKCVLRAAAVFDNVPYDPKKHIYETALAGQTGQRIKPCIDSLIELMYRISLADDLPAQQEFISLVDTCISSIG